MKQSRVEELQEAYCATFFPILVMEIDFDGLVYVPSEYLMLRDLVVKILFDSLNELSK